ncbi:hypothetical protein HY632_04190 [Candidatus Uhrbacteria bacterium]|nr:hypothetical protein [Candidatus Uhrbacteria bacterium]
MDPMWEKVLSMIVIILLIPGSFAVPVLAVGAMVKYILAKRRRGTPATSELGGQCNE